VALGWAQALADFIFWLRFIKPIYVIEPFAIARALLLIAVTGMISYIMGFCGALLWKRMHRRAVDPRQTLPGELFDPARRKASAT
jgi:hypothetical protein